MKNNRTIGKNASGAVSNIVDVKALLLMALIVATIWIAKPFFGLLISGAIVAITVYPLYTRLLHKWGNKIKLTIFILLCGGLIAIFFPIWLFADTGFETFQKVSHSISGGTLTIARADETIFHLPVVGELIQKAWNSGASFLESTYSHLHSQLPHIFEKLGGISGKIVISVVHLVLSLFIASLMLANSEVLRSYCRNLADKIDDERGQRILDSSITTIRAVSKGVFGVAFIQAALLAVGFEIISLPGADILTLVIFIVVIIQVPAIVVVAPIIGWYFWSGDLLHAGMFALYSTLVSLSDNILKPILFGKNTGAPVFVVMLGAIGGMMNWGLIGLFIGAVLLSVSFSVLVEWIGWNKQSVDSIEPSSSS